LDLTFYDSYDGRRGISTQRDSLAHHSRKANSYSFLEKELMRYREHITLWELGEIKKIYGISMQATIKRAKLNNNLFFFGFSFGVLTFNISIANPSLPRMA